MATANTAYLSLTCPTAVLITFAPASWPGLLLDSLNIQSPSPVDCSPANSAMQYVIVSFAMILRWYCETPLNSQVIALAFFTFFAPARLSFLDYSAFRRRVSLSLIS